MAVPLLPCEADSPEVQRHSAAEAVDGTNSMRQNGSLMAVLEGLLFVASEPVDLLRLAAVVGSSIEEVDAGLAQLAAVYEASARGVRLQRKNDSVQITSAPSVSPYIERFLGFELSTRLSPAAMEALAVIAYRQPLTRGDVEAIRGVNCDGVLRTLIARGLVEPVGRLEQAGRPFLYGTTFQFLQYLGLPDLEALPPLPEDGRT